MKLPDGLAEVLRHPLFLDVARPSGSLYALYLPLIYYALYDPIPKFPEEDRESIVWKVTAICQVQAMIISIMELLGRIFEVQDSRGSGLEPYPSVAFGRIDTAFCLIHACNVIYVAITRTWEFLVWEDKFFELHDYPQGARVVGLNWI
jgi:hypothetical protein